MRLYPIALAALLFPGSLLGAPQGRTELELFTGISLLNARSGSVFAPLYATDLLPTSNAYVFPYEQARTLGGSFVQGLSVARYVSHRAAAKISFAIAPTHDLRTNSFSACPPGLVCILSPPPPKGSIVLPSYSTEARVVAYRYDADFSYELARGEVRPVVAFGLGGVSYDTLSEVKTDFAFNFGGGLKMYFGRIGASLEFSDYLTPHHFLTGKAEHDLQIRGGVLVRLR